MANDNLITIALCDDDPEHIRKVIGILDRYFGDTPHRVDTFHTGEALLAACRQKRYTLVMLDIYLHEENGIELGKKLQADDPNCHILFLSSFISYAQDVYDVDHIAFILKKDMAEYLPKALDRFLRKLSADVPATMSVSVHGAWQIVKLPEVIYLERHIRKTTVYVRSGSEECTYETDEKIEDLLARVNSDDLIQCHKSYAVNWQHVTRYERNSILLDTGFSVPVSRNKAAQVMVSFQKWSF